nr:MvdC family ATP-grasp ribosomal peptide maturase [Bacteroidota bacterium]
MILLLTHTEDFYTVDLVKESLRKKGMNSIRIDLDAFPERFFITEMISDQGKSFELRSGDQRLHLNTVQGVWLRKYFAPKISQEIEPEFRDGCFRESKAVMDILLQVLGELPCIDPFEVIQKANNKFYQLETAKASGIRIPKTLITNDPEQLKIFYENAGPDIIAKMLTQLSTSMQGASYFMYTSMVGPEHMEDADTLKNCPMVFQEHIAKQYELRIIYVDGHFFTGKVNASGSKLGKTDWRKSTPDEVKWEHYTLPEGLRQQLSDFMKKIGLIYGAIDMICSAEGEYVFLEVNPTGEWGMLQRDLGLAVSDAIAQALVNRIKQ